MAGNLIDVSPEVPTVQRCIILVAVLRVTIFKPTYDTSKKPPD